MAEPPTCPPDLARDPGLAATVALIAWSENVAPGALFSRTRGESAAADARHMTMYLAHVVLGRDVAGLSRLFRRDPRSIRHALRRIEDQRDEPALDRRLAHLEQLITAVSQPPLPCPRRSHDT